jgi:Ulp1 family protease
MRQQEHQQEQGQRQLQQQQQQQQRQQQQQQRQQQPLQIFTLQSLRADTTKLQTKQLLHITTTLMTQYNKLTKHTQVTSACWRQ